ncbi:2-C-methyl-D-erythritol 4-phosphate cytidylyltransferase [Solirubrobacter phytolaccae]|uniref:2-C-methyl-D-erythritol 4-phosphate cytidylyltransferase n=1 Tax=Solirubrobacter phytolaccae TaxID=1404360 RepID=A0A9X3NHK2_9ACTN|nr:2-C-methyl-D-erythritol 4-phosphate cytidylyltransferase [Solirubrobacter phytolaccae]MDA0185454.1 2-C-methyl-D-erythritol 4-phosphate cytidylyltransferase [Solirubrobacter phytolaccae]
MAAGSGSRLGAAIPKAFVPVAGRPMIEWSVDALRAAGIEEIVVALPESGAAPAGCLGVRGGATRSESVRAALDAASGDGDVVVHDAARPLVEPSLFVEVVEALSAADCAIAAARVTDTIKEADGDVVVATYDRSRLWAVQTPQAFRRAALEAALNVDASVLATATDDASLVERAGGTVRVVEASPANFKVTTPHDLRIAELLLRAR